MTIFAPSSDNICFYKTKYVYCPSCPRHRGGCEAINVYRCGSVPSIWPMALAFTVNAKLLLVLTSTNAVGGILILLSAITTLMESTRVLSQVLPPTRDQAAPEGAI